MRMTHVFVESFPESLEAGKLYISMQYASATHLCACGCGHEVVTPIRRRDGWKLVFDGESISLSPSIGSRNLACRSHYFITLGQVRWALPMDQYDTAEQDCFEIKAESFGESSEPVNKLDSELQSIPEPKGFLDKLLFWRR